MIDIRGDGRLNNDVRRINLDMGLPEYSSQTGSAKFKIGGCESLAMIKGPFPANLTNEEEKINLRVTIDAPNSSKRIKDKNSQYSTIIRNTLLQLIYAVNDKVKLNIELKIIVIADNGDLLSTSFNASILALIDSKIPLIGTAAAVCLAVDHETKAILNDPDLTSLNKHSVLSVAKRDNGQFVMFHSEGAISLELMDKLCDIADKQSDSLIMQFKELVRLKG